MKKLVCLIISIHLALAGPVFASASILGISVGEDNYTLAGILAQAIQQVKFLSDLATMTRVMKDNIEFMKDVYGTANDVANGRWDELTAQFLETVINSDPSLREVYSNTQAIMDNRVPRGNGFRQLMGAAESDFLFQVFGPYPFGDRGNTQALTDSHSLSLNGVVDDIRQKKNIEHRAAERAWKECNKHPGSCERAQAELQMQTLGSLERLRDVEEERAKLEAHRALVESGQKRQRDTAHQNDFAAIADSFRDLRNQQKLVVPGGAQ